MYFIFFVRAYTIYKYILFVYTVQYTIYAYRIECFADLLVQGKEFPKE